MTRSIWVVSDTHFFHENVLKFTDSKTGLRVRPEFDTVEQMDECMMDNWNSVVKQGDIVYHLGDVFIGNKEKFKTMWPKLKGSKRLIVGNHDDVKFLASGGFFQKVAMWRMFPEFGLMLSHAPLHDSSLLRLFDRNGTYPDDAEMLLNVHGHTHSNGSPPGPYRSVCVELTGYKPVNIEELRIK